MRFKNSELEMVLNALAYEEHMGTPTIVVAPDQLVLFNDLINTPEYNQKSIILTPVSNTCMAYPVVACVRVLSDVVDNNKNIRPFTSYDSSLDDFVLDFSQLYICSFKELQLNNWHDVRKEILASEQRKRETAATIDPDYIEFIINKQLSQMCKTYQGAIVASEWYVNHKHDGYKFPDSAIYSLKKQPRLSTTDYEMLLARMKRNRRINRNKGHRLP